MGWQSIPPTIGQNTDKILTNFGNPRDYPVEDFLVPDDGNEDVIRNYNKHYIYQSVLSNHVEDSW